MRFATLMMADGGDLLSTASATAMQTRQQHRDLRDDQYYGLGTFVEYFQGNEMVHHDGGAWGWSATMKWIPEAGVAVATTSNIGGGHHEQRHQLCPRRLRRSRARRAPTPCRLDRTRWDDLVGTYHGSVNSGAAWTFEVTRPTADGNLQLRLSREGVDDATSS